MSKEATQERRAEKRIKDRHNGKKTRVTEEEKRRIAEMQEEKQFRDPLLLGSWKKNASKNTQNDKSHAQNLKRKKLSNTSSKSTVETVKFCRYSLKLPFLLGVNYSNQCPSSC